MNETKAKINNIKKSTATTEHSNDLKDINNKYDELLLKTKSDRKIRKINKKLHFNNISCKCPKGKNCWNGNENNNCSHGYKFIWENSDSDDSDINTIHPKLIN